MQGNMILFKNKLCFFHSEEYNKKYDSKMSYIRKIMSFKVRGTYLKTYQKYFSKTCHKKVLYIVILNLIKFHFYIASIFFLNTIF